MNYLYGGSGQNLEYFTLQKGAGVYAGYDEFETNTSSDNKAAVHLGTSKEQGVDTSVNITLNAEGGAYGLWAGRNGSITVDGKSLAITANQANSDGIAATNTIYHSMDFSADKLTEQNNRGSYVVLNGGSGSIVSINMNGRENGMENSHAIYANGYNTKVISGANGIGSFIITGNVAAENSGRIELHATDTNTANRLKGDLTADGEKSSASLEGYNVYMIGNAFAKNGGHVALTSESYGSLSGALTASGEKSQASMTSKGVNYVDSAAVIAHAGDLDQDKATDNNMSEKQVISALYAEDGAAITVSGQSNTFRTTANPNNSDQLERVIWAYNGADITVDGTTNISTDSYEKSANSADIAIAAGTAVNLTKEKVESAVANPSSIDHAVVTVNYDSYVDNAGTTVASSITGDIVSAYAGQVNIKKQDGAANAKINIEGNLLAGNGGILNVDLGNGGVLEGRADDYGDAGVVTHDSSYGEDGSFRHPAFSSDIYKGGAVNLTMGEGARWNVTGQSWITRIDTTEAGSAEDSGRAVIDLVSANTDRNKTAHALTISDMEGNAVFNMSLDGDRKLSDMLYMKNAKGDYIINVVDPVTTDDMYARRDNGELFNGLRFATVGTGSDVSFRAVTIGQGLMNVEYTVKTDPYKDNNENASYNSADGDGKGNEEKPGNEMVDGFFDQTGGSGGAGSEANSSAGQYIMLMAQNTRENSDTEKQENEQPDSVNETTNYKLTGIDTARVSNAGQTVLALSRVNYSNAVYMDRLNKRMGEARYIDGDDGLWVRLRHDRIGKEDAFRTMNTMFELGYDRKVQDQKDGEHRRGVAFDYMRGEADYTNVMGSGDVRRAGVWLYDTWLGDKGHYSDYVVKYGRLSNDFDIFNELGTKVSGDYDNDVWSASAEYGRKKDIGSEWYFEPQAQLQYAYVTSADYTTSQNTKVSLDGIDSLIGRAGFRLGRDTSEGNTVYFKADILHEFLGDQRVHASDITGALDTTYDNEGTWYDVGFGFSHRMGEDSYMFLDVEHSFGNDNEDTYQINIGLNRAF